MIAALGVGSYLRPHARVHELVVNLRPGPVVAEAVEIIRRRAPRRQVMRDRPPLAAGAIETKDRVDHLPIHTSRGRPPLAMPHRLSGISGSINRHRSPVRSVA